MERESGGIEQISADISSADKPRLAVEVDVPVQADPIAVFRGQGKGGGTARLLQERARDRECE